MGLTGSENRVQEKKAAPMAPRARRPSPLAAPAPPDPTLTDAIQFVLAVKNEFAREPGKYEEFLGILREARRIGIAITVSRVKALFTSHPDLIRGFNMFVPRGYEHEDHYQEQA